MAAAVASAQDATVAAETTTAPADTSTLAAAFPQASNILDKFSASATFGYESEYVFRGKKYASGSIMPQVDLGYDLGSGFALYTGTWSAFSTDSNYKEVNVYAGATYTYDFLSAEIGYIGYLYPDADKASGEHNTNEIKVAVYVDTEKWLGQFNVSPFAAYYYDFDMKGHTLEAGLAYSAPVTKWILNQEWGKINLGAAYGWNTVESNKYTNYHRNGYSYVMLSADAVVSINSYCALSVGVRYAYNNDYDQNPGTNGANSRVWFGSSLTIGF